MRALPWLLLSALAAPGFAGAVEPTQATVERASLPFVPAFFGGVFGDMTIEARFDGWLADDDVPFDADALTFHLGYLHYIDGHGRLSLGGYLGSAWSRDEGIAETVGFKRLDLGALVRLRAISDQFLHWSAAAFLEAGPVWLDRVPEGRSGDVAARWAFGVETGPGLLWHVAPYLFAETLGRIGLESSHYGGVQVWTVTAGLRIAFEYGVRGRDLPDCAINPREYGPCP
ncbi:MAG: hypothetical protein KC620_04675 [Myxococcales bacterium]|nr:hypothetical protein [Myxococcales bacterium]